MPPQQHPRPFGLTAADAFDEAAFHAECEAVRCSLRGDEIAKRVEEYPGRFDLPRVLVAERATAEALRQQARWCRSRADVIRYSDEAPTRPNAAAPGRWWRRFVTWLRVPFSS